jgi:hypothetical protein
MMQELRSWQALVSLWDRMEDRRLHMHEAPSTFEIANPAHEGWVMRRSKSGVFVEWRRQWAVLKRAHLFLYDRPDSSRPSNWYLLRKADVQVRGKTSGQKYVLELLLPHRRKVVLAGASAEDMQSWCDAVSHAIALGTADPRACRPLRCAPAMVKRRALAGVPDCFRGIVWQKLSGADALRQRHPDRYKALLAIPSPADSYIRRDLRRTMPKNAFFQEDAGEGAEGCAHGQALLFNVVHALAVHDPDLGYSQGINFLSAVLLLHMKQESAFWVLVQLMRRYRMRGLFVAKNPQLALEHFKLQRLTTLCTPALHQLFTEQGVDISVFISEWLITLFSYSFPLSFTFRVWDTLLVKGFSYVLQVAVSILRTFECQLLSLTFEAIIFFLREIPLHLAGDRKLADAILDEAHKVTWEHDALDAEAKAFVARCIARDTQRASAAGAATVDEQRSAAAAASAATPDARRAGLHLDRLQSPAATATANRTDPAMLKQQHQLHRDGSVVRAGGAAAGGSNMRAAAMVHGKGEAARERLQADGIGGLSSTEIMGTGMESTAIVCGVGGDGQRVREDGEGGAGRSSSIEMECEMDAHVERRLGEGGEGRGNADKGEGGEEVEGGGELSQVGGSEEDNVGEDEEGGEEGGEVCVRFGEEGENAAVASGVGGGNELAGNGGEERDEDKNEAGVGEAGAGVDSCAEADPSVSRSRSILGSSCPFPCPPNATSLRGCCTSPGRCDVVESSDSCTRTCIHQASAHACIRDDYQHMHASST